MKRENIKLQIKKFKNNNIKQNTLNQRTQKLQSKTQNYNNTATSTLKTHLLEPHI